MLLYASLCFEIESMDSFSLMIHGGASAIHAPERYEGSLRHVIEAGAHLLETGALALDAVEGDNVFEVRA